MSDLDDLLATCGPSPELTKLAAEPIRDPKTLREYRRILRGNLTPADMRLVGRALDRVRAAHPDDADEIWAALPASIDEYREAERQATRAAVAAEPSDKAP